MPSSERERLIIAIREALHELLQGKAKAARGLVVLRLRDLARDDGLGDEPALVAAEALLAIVEDEGRAPNLGLVAIRAVLAGLGDRFIRRPTAPDLIALRALLFGDPPAKLGDIQLWFAKFLRKP